MLRQLSTAFNRFYAIGSIVFYLLISVQLINDSERCADLESKLVIVSLIMFLCVTLILIFVQIENIPMNKSFQFKNNLLKHIYKKKIDRKLLINIINYHMNKLNCVPVTELEIQMLMKENTFNGNTIDYIDEICVFCMTLLRDQNIVNYDDNGKIIQLKCRHAFHISCAIEWFEKSLTCPVCRFNIRRYLINEVYNNELF